MLCNIMTLLFFCYLKYTLLHSFTDSKAFMRFVACESIIIIIIIISNSNWSEWSTIQGVIGRVISKS